MKGRLIGRALAFARERHAGQIRKGDGRPFIVHPLAVARILRRYRVSEPIVAAGFLHDVLEDTATMPEELRSLFGSRVAGLVAEVTEPNKRHSWEYRKRAYLRHLRHASRGALAISCADKLHNTLSLVRAYRREGSVVFERFSRGIDRKVEYHRSVYATVHRVWPRCPMLPELVRALNRLEKIERSYLESQPREIESKFVVEKAAVLRAAGRLESLGRFRRTRLGRERQMNIYWDTPDFRLRRARAALKVRRVGQRAEMTFKREVGYHRGVSQRIEITVPVKGERVASCLLPTRGWNDLPDPVRQARRIVGRRPLREVLRIRTDRTKRLFSFRQQRLALGEAPPRASAQRLAPEEAPPRASAQRLELALDRVRVVQGRRTVGTFLEIEMENLSADPALFEETLRVFRRKFQRQIRSSRLSKFQRGLRLLKRWNKRQEPVSHQAEPNRRVRT